MNWRYKIKKETESDLSNVNISSHDIDKFIDEQSRRIPSAKGGEIVVQSVETFDYPFKSVSREELRKLHVCWDRSIKRLIEMTPEQEAEDKKVEADFKSIFEGEPDTIKLRLTEYIKSGILVNEVPDKSEEFLAIRKDDA